MTMPFSDAIRLGAMLRGQAFGALCRVRDVPVYGDVLVLRVRTYTCAIGAGLEAVGALALVAERPELWWDVLERQFPAMHARRAQCPACPATGTVTQLAAHCNDRHRWTRERIADWVAQIEAQPATRMLESLMARDGPYRSAAGASSHAAGRVG